MFMIVDEFVFESVWFGFICVLVWVMVWVRIDFCIGFGFWILYFVLYVWFLVLCFKLGSCLGGV